MILNFNFLNFDFFDPKISEFSQLMTTSSLVILHRFSRYCVEKQTNRHLNAAQHSKRLPLKWIVWVGHTGAFTGSKYDVVEVVRRTWLRPSASFERRCSRRAPERVPVHRELQ